jgi:cyclophilin family peptidyl-prolyl cis-trans isomerase
MPAITDTVYLDITIEPSREKQEPFTGRLVIGLFGELLPRTTRIFRRLCENDGYKGSSFYRVLSDFTIQGGAINDPTGQTSTVEVFEPDNYSLRHTRAGLVSTVRHDSSGGADSRFFIQLQDDATWADDRYAAFGIVLQDGMSTTVKRIEQVSVKRPQNRPTLDVSIVGSGILSGSS